MSIKPLRLLLILWRGEGLSSGPPSVFMFLRFSFHPFFCPCIPLFLCIFVPIFPLSLTVPRFLLSLYTFNPLFISSELFLYLIMFLCSSLALFSCSSVPLFHCSTIPVFYYSNLSLFQSSTIPIFHYSNLPLFQYFTIPIFHCSYWICSTSNSILLWSKKILRVPSSVKKMAPDVSAQNMHGRWHDRNVSVNFMFYKGSEK